MSGVPAQARIRGIRREKKSGPLKLSKDVRRRHGVHRINATMGVVGLPESGRKTLAYRLANMSRGAFGEVPVAFFYTLYRGGRFGGDDRAPFARFAITIIIYILPQPVMPPRNTRSGATQYSGPHMFLQHLEDFCCLAMAFDVMNVLTLDIVSHYPSILWIYSFRVPTLYLVGNKCDRRSEPPPLNPHARPRRVPRETAVIAAEALQAPYFELSAKYNINVEPLYQRILRRAADHANQ